MMIRRLFIVTLFLALSAPFGKGTAQEVLFEDSFNGSLQPGWQWRRENPEGHRFVSGGLEILAAPLADSEAQNVLVRPFPICGGPFNVEAQITCLNKPTTQYQQGGIYWLRDGRVMFKLVHEYVDGQTYIFPGKIPVNARTVNLRIISNGDDVIAEYAADGDSAYRRVYEGKLSPDGRDEIGVQCWNGPSDARDQHWYRFKRFRVVRAGQ
ncbi:MAG: hypothetical protein J6S75_08520 [Thermoguttaceae bacterium]|nr:hypothetical protein [Thermoguttaceae bacterium]